MIVQVHTQRARIIDINCSSEAVSVGNSALYIEASRQYASQKLILHPPHKTIDDLVALDKSETSGGAQATQRQPRQRRKPMRLRDIETTDADLNQGGAKHAARKTKCAARKTKLAARKPKQAVTSQLQRNLHHSNSTVLTPYNVDAKQIKLHKRKKEIIPNSEDDTSTLKTPRGRGPGKKKQCIDGAPRKIRRRSVTLCNRFLIQLSDAMLDGTFIAASATTQPRKRELKLEEVDATGCIQSIAIALKGMTQINGFYFRVQFIWITGAKISFTLNSLLEAIWFFEALLLASDKPLDVMQQINNSNYKALKQLYHSEPLNHDGGSNNARVFHFFDSPLRYYLELGRWIAKWKLQGKLKNCRIFNVVLDAMVQNFDNMSCYFSTEEWRSWSLTDGIFDSDASVEDSQEEQSLMSDEIFNNVKVDDISIQVDNNVNNKGLSSWLDQHGIFIDDDLSEGTDSADVVKTTKTVYNNDFEGFIGDAEHITFDELHQCATRTIVCAAPRRSSTGEDNSDIRPLRLKTEEHAALYACFTDSTSLLKQGVSCADLLCNYPPNMKRPALGIIQKDKMK